MRATFVSDRADYAHTAAPKPAEVSQKRLTDGLLFGVGTLVYLVAFLGLSSIGLWALGYVYEVGPAGPDGWVRSAANTYPIAAGTLLLGAVVVSAACGWATVWLRDRLEQRPRVWTRWFPCALTGSAVVLAALALGWSWSFDLDDKWAYLRTARNVLRDGLPLWNPEDRLNIQASYVWPYVTAPGLAFDWNTFAKFVGVASFALAAWMAVRPVQDCVLRALGAAAVLLFFPLLLWSIGGLETAFAVFVTLFAAQRLIRVGPAGLVPWVVFGAMIFIRPDVALVGAVGWAAFFLRGRASLVRKVVCGTFFSAPVLLFIALNLTFFDAPLPRPYYIKGLNKAFSGHYPFAVDVSVGFSHLLSALSLNIVWVLLVGLLLVGFLTTNPRRWPTDELILFSGAVAHLAYIVAAGYQHMNFAFRYYIPSLAIVLLVALVHLDRRLSAGQVRRPASLLGFLSAAAVFVQIPVFALTVYQAHDTSMSLTFAYLQDSLALTSYSQFMALWLDAGQYLRSVEQPGDRLYLDQDIAGAALSDIYSVDTFYAPPQLSSYEDLRTCGSGIRCTRLYDYLLLGPGGDLNTPTHVGVKRYANLSIAKRVTRLSPGEEMTSLASGPLPPPAPGAVRASDLVVTAGQADRTPGAVEDFLRVGASNAADASLELTLDGIPEKATLLAVAQMRADGSPDGSEQLTITGDDAGRAPALDDTAVGQVWTEMGVAATERTWPARRAVVHLVAHGSPVRSLDVRSLQVRVNGTPVLSLDGRALAQQSGPSL